MIISTRDKNARWFFKSVLRNEHKKDPRSFVDKVIKKSKDSFVLASKIHEITGVHPYDNPQLAKERLVQFASTGKLHDKVDKVLEREARGLGTTKELHLFNIFAPKINKHLVGIGALLIGLSQAKSHPLIGEAGFAPNKSERLALATVGTGLIGLGAGRHLLTLAKFLPKMGKIYKETANRRGKVQAVRVVSSMIAPAMLHGIAATISYLSGRHLVPAVITLFKHGLIGKAYEKAEEVFEETFPEENNT